MKRCDNCEHWHKSHGGGMGRSKPNKDQIYGECRALPPRVVTREHRHFGVWPETKSGEFCGSYGKKHVVQSPAVAANDQKVA